MTKPGLKSPTTTTGCTPILPEIPVTISNIASNFPNGVLLISVVHNMNKF